jgi:pyruvate dehydrogenase E1 component subunit beta
MIAAIRDPDPVVFMEPKRSYRAFREEVPEAEEVLEIGKAEVVAEGTDLTLIAYGAMMRPALNAAEAIAKKSGAKIEVIDLLTISPLDIHAVVESVRKTGRCVIVQEAPRSLGVAAEIIAGINDRIMLHLEAPVRRVTGYDVVTPYFGRENMYIPTPERVGTAIQETLDF